MFVKSQGYQAYQSRYDNYQPVNRRPEPVAKQAEAAPQDRLERSHNHEHTHTHAEGEEVRAEGVDPGPGAGFNPNNYYDNSADGKARAAYYGGGIEQFAGKDGAQIFKQLSELVTKSHHALKYDPENQLYPNIDRHPDGKLYCIYSDGGPMFVGDASAKGEPMNSGFNCEHVVPQSWFGKKSTPRGDLHHLFACQSDCNSVRGNALYAEFAHQGPSGSGYNVIHHGVTDIGDNLFSPEAGKGEVARATLYFMMRYPGQIGDSGNEYGVKDLPMLIKWAQDDPPSDYERHRNAEIEKKQGNRNPLIDFPELTGKIDFSKGIGVQRRR